MDLDNPGFELLNVVFTIAFLSGFGLFLGLAYVGERVEAVRWVVVLVLVAMLGLFGLAGAPLALLGGLGTWQPDGAAMRGVADTLRQAGLDPDPVLYGWLLQAGGAMLLAALAGALLLLPPVRRAVARAVPIDPDRLVHTVALHYGLYLVVLSVATLVAIQAIVASPEDLAALGAGTTLSTLWAQAVGFVVIAVLGVGLGTRRGAAETLARLGLERRIDWRWFVGVVGAGLSFGLATDKLWALTSPDTLETVERLTDALFGPLLKTGLAGAVTIGVSAGIGEELLFRGAAQPRLGLPLTALLFAAVHTQYSLSPALIQVLALGVMLGLARQRANTTTAIAAHAAYNFILAALAIYAPEWAP
ncbi:hypothetical protein DCC79_01760 [bacterium]|nr:CPBP family intramembrane metalloprotease [Chloroflexi bacterium CFX6]RIL12321.1 MAG: hypothetical protein DCC79_01760 [bacterium]